MQTLTATLGARITRLILAVLAYGCFAAGQAKAGCGEHVVVMSNLSPEERSFFIRLLVRGGCQGSADGAAHADLAAAPRCASCPLNPLSDGPCRGPYCSGERPSEGVPVSPPTQGVDPWSLFVQTIKLQDATCAGNVEPADGSSPITLARSIFHPPRAA